MQKGYQSKIMWGYSGADMSRYIKTQYPGVRYREHKNRKHNGKPDRYFFIRYKRQGKSIEEAFGWASNNVNAQKANRARSELIENIRLGVRPQTLQEKREMEAAQYEAERQASITEERENFTLHELAERYIEWAKANKKSWKDDMYRIEANLKPFFGDMQLKDITPLLIENYRAERLEAEVSKSTVNREITIMKRMFNLAIDWNFAAVNPKISDLYPWV